MLHANSNVFETHFCESPSSGELPGIRPVQNVGDVEGDPPCRWDPFVEIRTQSRHFATSWAGALPKQPRLRILGKACALPHIMHESNGSRPLCFLSEHGGVWLPACGWRARARAATGGSKPSMHAGGQIWGISTKSRTSGPSSWPSVRRGGGGNFWPGSASKSSDSVENLRHHLNSTWRSQSLRSRAGHAQLGPAT